MLVGLRWGLAGQCVAAEVLDTIVTAETPEGILLELKPAGLTARLYAFLLDWMIRLMAMNVIFLLLAPLGGLGVGLALVVMFLLEWLYPVAFELSRTGATPGKRVFHIKVVMDNGLPVTPAASLTRNLLRVADFLPFAYGFAIVWVCCAATASGWATWRPPRWSSTRRRPAVRPSLQGVPPISPSIPLPPRDQAAVIALAVRAPTLTGDRLDELAALAAGVSGDAGRRGPEVTRRVLGVAQWLLGHRA